MMDFLSFLIKAPFEYLVDWPLGTLTGILFLAVELIIVGLVLYGLYIAVDSWFLPHAKRTGIVCKKEFIPAHTEIILIDNAATKTSLPHPVHHPDQWIITTKVGDKEGTISVNKMFYEKVRIESPVIVKLVEGRFSGDLYLKSICMV